MTESTRPRLLYILTCGWTGMAAPTIRMLEDRFPTAGTIVQWLPALRCHWNTARSFHPDRVVWSRRRSFLNEHVPAAFRRRTVLCDRAITAYDGGYEMILQNGVLHAPGSRLDRMQYAITTDSTRALSLANPHDEQCHFRSDRQAREWMALEGEVYRQAAAIIVGCEWVKRSLVDEYRVPAERVHNCGFVPGIGFEAAATDKAQDGRSILYVGKGDFEKKGGGILLAAFEIVRNHMPSAELYIVGQDNLPPRAGVRVVGFVRDRHVLRELFRRAHCFVLPSLVDRNPLTLIEAMATGTPSIASDHGALPEIVGDAGFVVPAGDPSALADRLLELLQNHELAKSMGHRARQRYLTTYAPAVVQAKYWTVLDALVSAL